MAGVLEFVSLSLFLGHLSPTRCAILSFSLTGRATTTSRYSSPVVTSCSRSEGSSRGYADSGRVVRALTSEPVGRAHARLTIDGFNRRYFQLAPSSPCFLKLDHSSCFLPRFRREKGVEFVRRVRRLLVDEMDREKLFSFSKEFGISSFYEIVNKYIIMYNIYGNSI